MKDVLFDCRDLDGEPEPDVMRNIDFSGATFEWVEFRGCRFEGVSLPQTPDLHLIPNYPRVAQRAVKLLADNSSKEAYGLAGVLEYEVRKPGRDDSVTVFNRADYLALGGEPLADLFETVLTQAMAETAP